MILYSISFGVLFASELFGNISTIAITKGYKQMAALTNAIQASLWCVKIVVVCNQPLTILTAFMGAYLGSMCACKFGLKK